MPSGVPPAPISPLERATEQPAILRRIIASAIPCLRSTVVAADVVGCGDSYLGPLAVARACRRLSGLAWRGVPTLVAAALAALADIAMAAVELVGASETHFLGAGPSFGVAALGMVKGKEATGARAMALQLEEFNRVQDAAPSASDALIAIAPGDGVADVTDGILTLAVQRGPQTLLLADNRSARLHRPASRVIAWYLCSARAPLEA